MLIASQLSRSGRLIRRYFFFFGFFFSFRMLVPFAMESPPLVNDLGDSLSVIIDTDSGGANQFLHVDDRLRLSTFTEAMGTTSTPPARVRLWT